MRRRTLLLLALACVPQATRAAPSTSPLGLWTTIDDHTGKPRAVVRIFEHAGLLYGRVERILDPEGQNRICTACSDDRHGKPMLGLEIIRGLRPDGDGWSGGEILDPETGKTYRASLRLDDDGRALIVRGSILGGLLGRSQTWRRADS